MDKLHRKFLTFLLLVLSPIFIFAKTSPANVFVLANKNVTDSQALALKYANFRNIPERNILLLDIPSSFDISRDDYNDKIAQPVFEFLRSHKAVQTVEAVNVLKDAVVLETAVDYLVICKGVPFRIKEKTDFGDPEPSPQKNNSAAVDSELAMLLKGKYPLVGFVKNPFFGANFVRKTYKQQLMIPVARLDGLSYGDASAIIDNTALAEKNGLRGRAYIDKSKKYEAGDKWLDNAAAILKELGYDVSEDSLPALMSFKDRMDGMMFYYGWYASDANAHFAEKSFKMAPGATAQHIYSFSASSIRQGAWAFALLSRGASATFGYINEPFLAGSHRADLYLLLLSRSYEAGEAAFYSMPMYSWKGVFFGDPMYSPFKVSIKEQIANIDAGKVDEFSQYAITRRMNMLKADQDIESAIKFGEKYVGAIPDNAALIWKISEFYEMESDTVKALDYAKIALSKSLESFKYCGLSAEILRYLDSKNLKDENAKSYIRLIDNAQGNEKYLKEMIPYVLKNAKLPDEIKEKYNALNEKLNPPKTDKK